MSVRYLEAGVELFTTTHAALPEEWQVVKSPIAPWDFKVEHEHVTVARGFPTSAAAEVWVLVYKCEDEDPALAHRAN